MPGRDTTYQGGSGALWSAFRDRRAETGNAPGDSLFRASYRRLMSDESRTDSDRDGLSDAVERRLGTNVNNPDSDGDGLIDGFEVAVDHPRVRDLGVKDPAASAKIVEDLVTGIEQAAGITEHNVDTDGDGFADWVEEMRGGSSRIVADLDPDTINKSGANPNPLDAFIDRAQSQIGAKNRFGAEVDLDDGMGSNEFDSSELVQWAAHQAGAELPDGSWKQYRSLALSGNDVSVEAAIGTKGALLFGFSGDPMASADRPDRAYVAISLGNGKVLEISERTGELKEVDAAGRDYTHAATIPEFHADAFDDTDGDGHHDLDEELMGGDPTTGMTKPWRNTRDMDTDGDGVSDAEDVDPNDPNVSSSAPESDDAGAAGGDATAMAAASADADAPADEGAGPVWSADDSVDDSAGSIDVTMSDVEITSYDAPAYESSMSTGGDADMPVVDDSSYADDSSYDDAGVADAWADG